MGECAVVVVMGASGGVGASALAAALAVRAVQAGVEVVAVDLRPLGGGLDVTFGAEQETGVRWADLVALSGAADASALVSRLPRSEGVPVLSFGREDPSVPEIDVVVQIVAALAGSRRLVVVDAAPETAFAQAVLTLATLVVVVAGGELRQLAALSALGRWLEGRCADVVVCLRGDRRVGELGPLVEASTGLSVIGVLSDDRMLRGDLVHGVAPGTRGRGTVAAVADECLARALLGQRAGVGARAGLGARIVLGARAGAA